MAAAASVAIAGRLRPPAAAPHGLRPSLLGTPLPGGISGPALRGCRPKLFRVQARSRVSNAPRFPPFPSALVALEAGGMALA
eukprot:SM000078S22066  [mRNA]  locus=s78:220462:220707:+ [translate_table: standard]